MVASRQVKRANPYWGVDLWERETAGLALGMFTGKKFAEHISIKLREDDLVPEGGASLGREKRTYEVRVVKTTWDVP